MSKLSKIPEALRRGFSRRNGQTRSEMRIDSVAVVVLYDVRTRSVALSSTHPIALSSVREILLAAVRAVGEQEAREISSPQAAGPRA